MGPVAAEVVAQLDAHHVLLWDASGLCVTGLLQLHLRQGVDDVEDAPGLQDPLGA